MHTGINREIILLAMNYTHALKLSRAYAPLNAPLRVGSSYKTFTAVLFIESFDYLNATLKCNSAMHFPM